MKAFTGVWDLSLLVVEQDAWTATSSKEVIKIVQLRQEKQ